MNRRSFIRNLGTAFVGAVLLPKLELPPLTERVDPLWHPVPGDITPYVWSTGLKRELHRYTTVETFTVMAIYRLAGQSAGSVAMWGGNVVMTDLESVSAYNVSALYEARRDNLYTAMRRELVRSHRPGRLLTRLPVAEQKLDNGLYVGELAQVQWVPIDYLRWMKVEEYGQLKDLIPFEVFAHPYGARETRYIEQETPDALLL